MTKQYNCKENDNQIRISSSDDKTIDQLEFRNESDPGWTVIGSKDLKSAVDESPFELYSDAEIIQKFFDILRSDKDYYRSWKDNIAMSFKDAFFTSENMKDDQGNDLRDKIHKIANCAAENFLWIVIKKERDWMEYAEKLYRYINPESKMDVPSFFYEKVKKWNDEWQITDTRLSFYDWCLKTKRTTGEE